MELIDRGELLSGIRPVSEFDEKWACTGSTVKKLMIKHISRAPTVDAVPVVHGHWIYDASDMRCVCSECNHHLFQIVRLVEFKSFAEQNKFCFNCGAKMDWKVKDGSD